MEAPRPLTEAELDMVSGGRNGRGLALGLRFRNSFNTSANGGNGGDGGDVIIKHSTIIAGGNLSLTGGNGGAGGNGGLAVGGISIGL